MKSLYILKEKTKWIRGVDLLLLDKLFNLFTVESVRSEENLFP